MPPFFDISAEVAVFAFFFFSFSGWVGETIMESAVRRRFVSKGFFRGPYVPVHGIGAFLVYGICRPLAAYPPLVFLAGVALCTAVEYAAALVLEKCFFTRGWDYDTYPFTYWCNYKRRVALTTSLFFGLVAVAVVYFYWDFTMMLAVVLGPERLFALDAAACALFLADAVHTGRRHIINHLEGIPNKTAGLP
jgi:uncharacterized membrane protein